MSDIIKKLVNVQSKLKAKKGQYNAFGEYRYRSCEDILEAVKPLLLENGLALIIKDEPITLGNRFYIKATATVINSEKPTEYTETTAYAREVDTKKGMDVSQITGATSSYARKYALNGLFCIDDSKDADSYNNKVETPPKEYYCDACHKKFKPAKDNEGKIYTAEDIYKKIKSTSKDGTVKCKECRDKEKEERCFCDICAAEIPLTKNEETGAIINANIMREALRTMSDDGKVRCETCRKK